MSFFSENQFTDKRYVPVLTKQQLYQALSEDEKNLIPRSAVPAPSAEESFEEKKQQNIRLYVYASRFIYLTKPYHPEDIGFALFSADGLLLKIYGPPQFKQWCREKGIFRNTVWRRNELGSSAITLGLETKRVVQTTGGENFAEFLQGCSVCFAPILLNSESALSGKAGLLGGIAVFSSGNTPRPDLSALAAAIAFDIGCHIYMSLTTNNLYATEKTGFLQVDVSMRTNVVSIAYHNEEFFHVLNIRPRPLEFKRFDEVFAPCPENESLLDMIFSGQPVNDKRMYVVACGKKRDVNITMEPYLQPMLGLRGCRIKISTPQSVAAHLSKQLGSSAVMSFDNLIGESQAYKKAIAQAWKIAQSDSNALILGESGVGKDVIAQSIHNASHRRGKPFVAVNCAAFPRDLIASELFGYESGAYTGARREGHIGKFELANGGTIFLDEIGDMPIELQPILLRIIEQKSFMRIGSNREIHVDLKIISATNMDLGRLVEQRTFRADLYYRLSTLKLMIPPLRERGEDVILLAEHFIDSISKRISIRDSIHLSRAAKDYLCTLDWPGNVRELQNLIEGIVQLYSENVIEPSHIAAYLDNSRGIPAPLPAAMSTAFSEKRLTRPTRHDLDRNEIIEALQANGYNREACAEQLGISRKTLYRRMKELGL